MKQKQNTKQPASVVLLEGHVVLESTGSAATDRRAMKRLQTAISSAIKATGFSNPRVSLRRNEFENHRPTTPAADYQQLADRLADLIGDPQMPEEAAELLDDAATEFINRHNNGDPDFVRRRFAVCCAISVTGN